LKLFERYPAAAINGSFESTYKELKLYLEIGGVEVTKSFESTYKELKPYSTSALEFLILFVLSLPIRN